MSRNEAGATGGEGQGDRASMEGKTCVVTGASSGIGRVTARELAAMGATVVMAGHDPARSADAFEEVSGAAAGAEPRLEITDLSTRAGAKEFVDRVLDTTDRIDVLVNNAGLIFGKGMLTEDGLERTIALNHFGYWWVTMGLLDRLKESSPARIVNVASEAHRGSSIRPASFTSLKGYLGSRAYQQSKLANIMFTYALARRLEGTGVTVNALHPGAVASRFGQSGSLFLRVLVTVGKPFMISNESGADTVVYLASSPEVDEVSGLYFYKRRPIRSNNFSYREDEQEALWQLSEELA